MAGLDSFLDFIIPPAIFLIFGFIIYRAFGEEFKRLGRWIKKKFQSKEEEMETPVQTYQSENWYS